MNKIAKSTLAIVLGGAVTFPSSLAFANAGTDEVEKYPIVDLQSQTLIEEQQVSESNIDIVNNTEAVAEELETIELETPSLLPGDMFYFAKIVVEKIKLALTFDDVKEAELLATYASERMLEVEALFKEGKEDEAQEIIENALEYMEDAEFLLDQEINSDQEEATANGENENDTVSEDEKNVEEDADETEAGDIEEVQELVSQNIIALQAALEKVKNPVAKAALQKNIDKSYAKLAKKLEKFEAKQVRKASKKKPKEAVINDDEAVVEVEEKLAVETEPTTEPEPKTEIESESATESNSETRNSTIEAEAVAEVPVVLKNEEKANVIVEKKEAQVAAKQQKAQVKEETKQARETMKQEAKEMRQEAKEMRQEAKETKHEVKQEVKEQKQQLKQNATQQEETARGKGHQENKN